MTLQQKQESILKGNLYRTIVILSIPIVINNLIQTLYNLVDGLWVGRIGSTEFAAISFVWPVNFLFVAVGMGLSVAGTSLLAQLLGAGEKKKANEYASQLIVLSLLLGVVLAAVGAAASGPIVRLMGGEGRLQELSTLYLRIAFLDMPFMFFFYIFNSIMNAQGNTVAPTVLSGVSAVMNMVLDPIFIFGLDLGVAGAAIATVLSKVTLALLGAWVLYRDTGGVYPSFHGFRFDGRMIKDSLRIAVPATVGQSGSSIGFIVLNAFIVSYGTSTMAAFGMVNRVFELANQPLMSMGTALVAIVGQNIGANQLHRVKEAFGKVVRIALGLGACIALLLFFARGPIIDFFLPSRDDPSAVQMGLDFMRIFAISAPLMGIFGALQGLFQGSGHTKYSMAMEISRLWFMRIPLILFFKTFTEIGATGIWISMSLSNLLICVFGLCLYKWGGWQKRPQLQHMAAGAE